MLDGTKISLKIGALCSEMCGTDASLIASSIHCTRFCGTNISTSTSSSLEKAARVPVGPYSPPRLLSLPCEAKVSCSCCCNDKFHTSQHLYQSFHLGHATRNLVHRISWPAASNLLRLLRIAPPSNQLLSATCANLHHSSVRRFTVAAPRVTTPG